MAITLTEARTNITTAVKENRRSLYKLRAFLLTEDVITLFYGLQTLINPSHSPELNRLLYKHRPQGIRPIKKTFNFSEDTTQQL